ncbi:MAG TPA: hypothetical protein VMM77_10165 [Gemmatimonadaceae bacterium]|nr:hypothetical protein [Gemmatimonadaceae bacterium]
MAPIRVFVIVVVFAASACNTDQADVGSYRIATVRDGLFGFRCQPRTEFYFKDQSTPDLKLTYLGACGAPRFVTEQLGMAGNPSCFAVSEEGSSLVYFHRPNWCGAGGRAKQKPGGVYLHSARNGDSLLYSDQDQVSQLWSRTPTDPHAIRVGWKSATPSRSGAACSQQLLIFADGSETPERLPRTIHGCQGGRSSEGTGDQ